MEELRMRYEELMGKLDDIRISNRRRNACMRDSVDKIGSAIFDVGFLERCKECLERQVKSRRRGVTNETRINELAETIKLLRSCLRDYILKTKLFIETCTSDSEKANEGVLSLLKKLDVLEKRLRLANEETKKLEKEKAELQVQYDKDRSLMKSKLESTLQERNSSLLKMKQLLKEKGRLESESKQNQKRLQQLQGKYANLKQRSSNEVQSTKKTCSEMRSTIDALKQEKEKIEQEFTTLQESERIVRIQLQHTTDENSSLKVELSIQGEQLANAKNEIQTLNNNLRNKTTTETSTAWFQEKVSKLKDAFQKSEAHRRQLHQRLSKSEERLLVGCRVQSTNGKPVIQAHPQTHSLTLHLNEKSKSFSFDRVYDSSRPSSSQGDVYHDVKDLVQGALYGEQISILCFGQRGSGKTYTMIGDSTPVNHGLIPRALHQESIYRLKNSLPGLIGWKHQVEVTMVEVYSKGIRDLLHFDSVTHDQNVIRDQSSIRGTTIRGATIRTLASRTDIETLLKATKQTSGGHVILTLYINGKDKRSGNEVQGVLNLVDLVGFERLDESQEETALYKEACCVNRSLSCLTDVLSGLASNQKHIPYRNSKLTYYLQPSLANGKTLVLCHLCPSVESTRDSIRTVKFALQLQSKQPRNEASKSEVHLEKKLNNGAESNEEKRPAKRQTKLEDKEDRYRMSPERQARKRKSSQSTLSTQDAKQRNLI